MKVLIKKQYIIYLKKLILKIYLLKLEMINKDIKNQII